MSPAVDLKDKGVKSSFSDSLASNPFLACVRGMYKAIEEEKPDLVTFMGDLTTKGDLGGYNDCLQYLAKGMCLGTSPIINPDNILFVAGNHDVCRKTAIEKGVDEKFKVLNDMLSKNGFSPLTTQTVDHRKISNGKKTVHAYGLNSSIGCAEKRHLSSRVADLIFKKIEDDLAADIDKRDEILDDAYEVLDAPAIHSDTIAELVTSIQGLSETELGVLIAHHNILPQATPRVEAYTELVNSGSFRSTVSQLGHPLLFLHGHIHTDPIEVIYNPIYGKRPLICISAPAFDSGFNLLEIGHDRSNRPIGCKITPYRINSSGYLTKEAQMIVPFGHMPVRILNDKVAHLASIIIRKTMLTWSDLGKEIDSSAGIDDDEIPAIVDELQWHGLISIENKKSNPETWRIRSLMG